MKNVFVIFSLLLMGIIGFTSCDPEEDFLAPNPFTLKAVGVATGVPVTTTIEGIDKEVTGTAFSMDFFDEEGKRLGTLTDISVSTETFPDGSMKGENYSIFTYDDDQSTIVMHNFIEMTPIDEVTLQAVILPKNTLNNVIGGTGRFAGKTGGATLNATLDMTKFAEGIVDFDCVYTVTW